MAPYCKSDHRLDHAKHHTRRSYCTSSCRYHQQPQQALHNVVQLKTNVGHTTNSIIAKKSICNSYWRCMINWGRPPQLDHGRNWIFITIQTWIAWWPTMGCWWNITRLHKMGYISWWICRCFRGTYTTAPQTNLTSNRTTRPNQTNTKSQTIPSWTKRTRRSKEINWLITVQRLDSTQSLAV